MADIFQRRHYEELARIMRDMPAPVSNRIDDKESLIIHFANELEAGNSNFNRERFVRACRA